MVRAKAGSERHQSFPPVELLHETDTVTAVLWLKRLSMKDPYCLEKAHNGRTNRHGVGRARERLGVGAC